MNKAILTILLCSLSFLEGSAKKVYDLKWNIKEQKEVLYDLTIKTSNLKSSDIDSTKSISSEDTSTSTYNKELKAAIEKILKTFSDELDNAKQKISFACTTPDIIDVKMIMYINFDCIIQDLRCRREVIGSNLYSDNNGSRS